MSSTTRWRRAKTRRRKRGRKGRTPYEVVYDVGGENLSPGLEERVLSVEVGVEGFGEERGEGRVERSEGGREGREGGGRVDFGHDLKRGTRAG